MIKLLFLINSINGLYNFRRELIQTLIDLGYEIFVAAPKDDKMSYFNEMGCKCIETPVNRRGTNPLTDLKLLIHYIKIIKRVEPNVVLTYTIKPNVYGGLACSLLCVPYIANITGLGTSIENKGLIQKISLSLYRIGLRKANCVFFQNESNKLFFTFNSVVKSKTKIIPGSGVNTAQHTFEEYPDNDRSITFLFLGRIMKSKGIDELLEASKKVKLEYPNVHFNLVGRSEEDYTELLKELEKSQVIKYHGPQNDVHDFIKNCHAIINPSYHEGMSNVLLESASTGRPVLASNIPGCRETFVENVSGFGFEVRNVDSLVAAIIKFINLPYEDKRKMGLAGRRKMEQEFDRNLVIDAYMNEIDRIINEEN